MNEYCGEIEGRFTNRNRKEMKDEEKRVQFYLGEVWRRSATSCELHESVVTEGDGIKKYLNVNFLSHFFLKRSDSSIFKLFLLDNDFLPNCCRRYLSQLTTTITTSRKTNQTINHFETYQQSACQVGNLTQQATLREGH